jgi:hypothetical protein
MEKKIAFTFKKCFGRELCDFRHKNDKIIIESNYSEILIFGFLKDRNQPIHLMDPYFRCLAPHEGTVAFFSANNSLYLAVMSLDLMAILVPLSTPLFKRATSAT